jgi:hemerythrin-like domain-containing protein
MSRHHALAAIEDQHRSISAVIHGLQHLAGAALARDAEPDLALLRAMLSYVREYPERLHHPAEDRTLFARLRQRTREADALIAELEAEHAQGEGRLEALAEALRRLEAGAPDGAAAFARQVREYADFHWSHMRKEEEQVFPVAERALVEEDWQAIRQAFEAHGDPRFGEEDAADGFRRLFSRIVALAPPPIGVGPER